MFKKVVILIVILSSVSLYTLIIFPDRFINVLRLAVPVAMFFLFLVYRVYDNSYRFKPKFRIEVGLILFSVVLSMFGAYYFHKQDFAVTAVAQRFIYFIMFYPLLHVLKPKPEFLIKLIIILGIFYAVLYIIQILIYPTELVSAKIFVDRETLRISLPGSGFLMLAYLIGLSRLIKTNNLKYLLLCLLSLIVLALLGTRQVIAPAALVTILSVLFSKRVKSRPLIIVLIAIATIPVYFIFLDIFNAMFEVSKMQATNYQGDIRVKAATFFLLDFFPNTMSYIIGNGVPSALSPYGIRMNAYAKFLGYYQSDIGIIGDYTKFGILIVIAQISMYARVMSKRLPLELDFIKNNFLIALLTIFFGSSFGYADYIVIICISLYLIDTASYFNPPDTGVPAADMPNDEKPILIQ
jgi:hypothetical protein